MAQGVESGAEVFWQNNVIFILTCPTSKPVIRMYLLDNYRVCSVAGIVSIFVKAFNSL